MGCPLYLAMTAAEFHAAKSLPAHPAWMACHFSPNGKGLSNIPQDLPPGSMLLVDDMFPVQTHEPKVVARELADAAQRFSVSRVLLDFQRPDCLRTKMIIEAILTALPCPVGVSHLYASDSVPVFVPPVPEDVPVSQHLSPYQSREIWMEVANDPVLLTVTEAGCTQDFCHDLFSSPEHRDSGLFCHYRIRTEADRILFSLYRTREDIRSLCDAAATYGVTCAVGLWQHFR